MTYLYLRQSTRLGCQKRFSNVEQSPGGEYCGRDDGQLVIVHCTTTNVQLVMNMMRCDHDLVVQLP